MAMKNILYFTLLLVCITAVTCAQQTTTATSAGETLMGYVKGIEGKDPSGRKQFIKDKLKEFELPFTVMPFETILAHGKQNDTIHGENIIVTMGSGKQKIVLGAHCDAVPKAPGANDNGGGVAVVLEILRTLKAYHFNHTVDFCFFDQEEAGLIGSAAYVRRYDTTYKHLAMINLDVEGTGNEIYVGPVGGGDDSLVMKYIHEARDKTKFIYQENEIYPGSDQESFAAAHMENISISVVPKGDVEKLVKWTKSGFKKIEDPKDVPEVLKVMHSPEDKSTYMTPEALNMSYEFTKTALLSLDAGEK
jgi:hypothetical protein